MPARCPGPSVPSRHLAPPPSPPILGPRPWQALYARNGLPRNVTIPCLTYLRDPVKHLVSYYYWYHQGDKHPLDRGVVLQAVSTEEAVARVTELDVRHRHFFHVRGNPTTPGAPSTWPPLYPSGRPPPRPPTAAAQPLLLLASHPAAVTAPLGACGHCCCLPLTPPLLRHPLGQAATTVTCL